MKILWNLLCQYNNIYEKNSNGRKKKMVAIVATVPPGTVATTRNLKKKKGGGGDKVPHQISTVDKQWKKWYGQCVNTVAT